MAQKSLGSILNKKRHLGRKVNFDEILRMKNGPPTM
jgi:hypothetical protein